MLFLHGSISGISAVILFCVLQSCGLQPQRSSRRVILPFFFSFYAKTCESTRARTYNYINTLSIKCVQFWIENML